MSTLIGYISEFTATNCPPILLALVLVGIIVVIFGKRR